VLAPWLRAVFDNLRRDHARGERRELQCVDCVELPDDQPDALDVLLEEENVDRVRGALSELPPLIASTRILSPRAPAPDPRRCPQCGWCRVQLVFGSALRRRQTVCFVAAP
jgi:hypothetical protein